jgi:hypothetical protein
VNVGCVNWYFEPTVTFDARTNPLVEPVAQHIYNAQTNPPSSGGLQTKWGIPPNSLSRDTSEADRRANNNAACRSVVLGPEENCDEFPMASTYEGAAFQPDFSAVAVPTNANSSQGGILNAFYSGANRVVDGDFFYVKAILADGSASW